MPKVVKFNYIRKEEFLLKSHTNEDTTKRYHYRDNDLINQVNSETDIESCFGMFWLFLFYITGFVLSGTVHFTSKSIAHCTLGELHSKQSNYLLMISFTSRNIYGRHKNKTIVLKQYVI
jgi:hypothetical protein